MENARVLIGFDELFEVKMFKKCLKCKKESSEIYWTEIDCFSNTYDAGYFCPCEKCGISSEHYVKIKYTGNKKVKNYK